MRILITGSRTWTDKEQIRTAIKNVVRQHHFWPGEGICIVEGKCPTGADELAHQIAIEEGWTPDRYPADWNTHGKRAGFLRNAEMVGLGADWCLAFIKNQSKGATMCANLAEKAGIPTIRYTED